MNGKPAWYCSQGLTALHCFATGVTFGYDSDACDAVDFDTLKHTVCSLEVYEMSNEAEVQEKYALHESELRNASTSLKKLLEAGADINVRDYKVWTLT